MSADLLGEARRRLEAGDPGSAHRLAERALETGRASGSPKATAAAAHLVGECLYALGEIAGSRRHADEALVLSQELGDPAALGADLNLLGVLDLTEGRTEDGILAGCETGGLLDERVKSLLRLDGTPAQIALGYVCGLRP